LSCPELEAIEFFPKPTRPVFKNLLFLSLLAVLGFFGWKHFTAPPPPPTQTPEQQVSAFLSQSVLPAAEFAALCEKYPNLVTEALKGQRLAVSGVLSKALVHGVNSNDLALELEGTPRLKIMFQSQFGKKERWGAPAGFRFQKKGKEIKINGQTLCSEGNTITLRGEFRHISPGWVKCDLLELP
jgi:hypothetical protein